jgi:hypothetical protein
MKTIKLKQVETSSIKALTKTTAGKITIEKQKLDGVLRFHLRLFHGRLPTRPEMKRRTTAELEKLKAISTQTSAKQKRKQLEEREKKLKKRLHKYTDENCPTCKKMETTRHFVQCPDTHTVRIKMHNKIEQMVSQKANKMVQIPPFYVGAPEKKMLNSWLNLTNQSEKAKTIAKELSHQADNEKFAANLGLMPKKLTEYIQEITQLPEKKAKEIVQDISIQISTGMYECWKTRNKQFERPPPSGGL